MEVRDPVLDRAPVRQEPTQPPVVDERHLDPSRLFGHGVLGLLLGADEEDRAVAGREIAREVLCLVEQLGGLLQVDDVDAAALGEDESLHLRVPAARLMTEMDSGLEQLAHGDARHG